MPAQRRIDLILESVRRLLRMGATPNLLNLLQKQHPADLAQIFAELPEKERHAAFNILVEKNGKLAMEALSELGPEKGAELLALRSGRGDRPAHPGDSVRRRGGADRPPAGRAVGRRPRPDPAEARRRRDRAARVRGADRRPLDEPERLRAGRGSDGRRSRSRRCRPRATSRWSSTSTSSTSAATSSASSRCAGCCSCPPDTPLKRIMTTDVYSARVDTDQEEVARQVASYNLLAIPVVDAENKLVGVITVDDVIDVIKDEATEDVFRLAGVSTRRRRAHAAGRVAAPAAAVAAREPGDGVSGGLGRRPVHRARSARSWLWRCSCRSSPAWAATRRTQTLAVIVRGLALGELTWSNARQALCQGRAWSGSATAWRLARRRRSARGRSRGDWVLGAHPDGRDDHQHVRGGHGRHARFRSACGRSRSIRRWPRRSSSRPSPTSSASCRSSAWRPSSCGSCTSTAAGDSAS